MVALREFTLRVEYEVRPTAKKSEMGEVAPNFTPFYGKGIWNAIKCLTSFVIYSLIDGFVFAFLDKLTTGDPRGTTIY